MSDLKVNGELKEHPGFCPECGSDSGPVKVSYSVVYACTKCKIPLFGWQPDKPCFNCKSRVFVSMLKKLSPKDKVPGELCPTCLGKAKAAQTLISSGGIYFRCLECRATGVFNASHPLSKSVREQENCPAPEPAGLEFEKCTEHSNINLG